MFISRELTELQGGEIGVESTAGAGSKSFAPLCSLATKVWVGTFAFFIKARKAVGEQSTHPGTPGSRMTNGSAFNTTLETMSITPQKTHRDYHILLVEDNLINQKVLSKQLRTAGCVVHVANHGT